VLEHDGATGALAVGVPDPRVGQEIGPLVVRRSGAALSCDNLRRHLDKRLAPFKQPRIIRFVSTLPALPNGKPSRGQAALALSEAGSGCA
jgi:acyl-CoA synthetase (AMP-forming)/AMP-acid ligase II